MYREFFGLTSLPFNNTPDPRFFFNTPDHEEALASLLYAVEARKGFVLVTGEVGSGKTLLSRLLLNRLPSNVRTAVITNTNLSGPELLTAICREFGIETGSGASAAEMTVVLEQFLLEQYSKERLAVVILDEAQNLPNDSLEQLRMLGNLEADDAKLLQVLILGQPELQQSFRQPAMQQTFQRIFRTFHLQGLDREMSAAYIAHRLKIAGLDMDRRVFDHQAIDAIYEFAQGIPRLINQICDNAMLAAYGDSCSEISAQFIGEVVEQMMTLAAPLSHMLGGGAQGSPVAPDAPGSTNPTSQKADAEGSSQTVRSEDISPKHLSDLTARLAAMEKSLNSGGEDASSPESLQSLQYEALRMVRNLFINTQDIDRQMRDILNRTQWTALAAEERAAADARLGDEHRQLLSERTERLMQESQSLARDQQSQFTQEADRRMRELLDKARQSARAVEDGAKSDIEAGRHQQAALQEQTKCLMAEMQSLARSEHSKFVQAAEQQMKDLLEQARQSARAVEENAKADTEAGRRQQAAFQEQTKCLMAEMQALASSEHSKFAQTAEQQMAELLEQARQSARAVEESAEADIEVGRKQHAVIREQTERLMGEMRSVARSEQSKFAQAAEQQMAELLEQARQTTQEIEERAAVDAESISKRNAELQEQIRDLMDKVHELTRSHRSELATVIAQQQAELESIKKLRVKTIALNERTTSLQTDCEDRVRKTAEDAETTCEQLKAQATSAGNEARLATQQLQDQIGNVLADVTSRSEASQARAAELLAQQRADSEAARRNIDEFTAALPGYAAEMQSENKAILDNVRAEAGSILDKIRGIHDRTEVKAQQVNGQVEEFSGDMQSKFEASHRKIGEIVAAAEREVETACASLQTARDEVLAEGENGRKQTNEAIEQTKSLLSDTRDQCAELLSGLQEEVTEQTASARNIWQAGEREGSETLSELLARLTDAREETDSTRSEHESLIQRANEELVDRRSALESGIKSHKDDVARLADDAHAIKDELDHAARQVETVRGELQESIRIVQGNATECQAQFRIESETIQKELTELVEQNRGALEDARTTVKSLAQKADQTTKTTRADIETMLTDAKARADAIRGESESMAADLAERMKRTRDGAAQTVAKAEETTGLIRRQSKRSLDEVRSCLGQMNERSEILRRELLRIGEGICEAATTATKQVQGVGERVTTEVKSLREIAQRDADANHDRLATLQNQVEQSAERMQQSAGKLLDQVQAGTSSLRQHADQLLAQAQDGAEKLNESAAGMLGQAQTTAEHFAERAKDLLHQAETTAENVGNDIREFRSQFETESKQVEQQAAAIKQDMAVAREDAVRLRNDTAEARKEAGAKADQILKRAEAVQKQSEALLSLPKKLVDEARQQAGALAKMSTKISTVIHQLSSAEKTARERKEQLEGTNVAADEKLTLLKQHTKRVGQLVGIIRQLYGAMDARIARLQGRLIKADDLVRSVPQEIEILRNAFESSDRMDVVRGGVQSTMPARSAQRPIIQEPNRLPPMGAAPAHAKTVVRAGSAVAATASGDSANTLGQIVQRNQKLNDWLRDMVGEEAVAKNALKTAGQDQGQQVVQTKT